jgi:DNA primase
VPIPEHTIDEILERVDLVALVGRHVELKKSGKSFKGRCPFHQEKSASFYVTPELRRFKCFGCQAGGDAIAFVQRYLGKTFVDAVRDLAREVGVDLSAAEDPSARERQHLREVTDLALEHFKNQLWHPTEGQTARAALVARGVSEETARTFGLGWAPEAWSRLADLLLARGLLEFGIQAGLLQRRSRGDGAYDVFRGRLMVPIRAPDGRVVAFGGRLLQGEGAKYLNSKESRLYAKSETLYGLDRARDEVRRRRSVVLVEGYFDVMGLHQAGVTHAVALCSTALTPGHLQQLQRVEARELVLLLDGDEAGRKAVERLAPVLLAAGASTRVALLPEGEDPDTFARSRGGEAVRTLLGSAMPLSEHLFRTLLPEGRAASFERKMEALGRLRPVVAELPVGLLRSAFFSGLAAHSGLPAAELEAGLRGKRPLLRPVPKPGPAAAPVRVERPLDRAEGALGALFLTRPELIRGAAAAQVVDEVTHPGLRSVLAQLQAGAAPADALDGATPRLRTSLEAAQGLLPRDAGQFPEALETLARRLKLARVKERLDHIARSTALLVGAHELDEETKRLQEERGELLRLKRLLEAAPSPTPTGSL